MAHWFQGQLSTLESTVVVAKKDQVDEAHFFDSPDFPDFQITF